VIVDMLISETAGDVQKIIEDLVDQLKLPSAPLMQGKVTRKTKKDPVCARARCLPEVVRTKKEESPKLAGVAALGDKRRTQRDGSCSAEPKKVTSRRQERPGDRKTRKKKFEVLPGILVRNRSTQDLSRGRCNDRSNRRGSVTSGATSDVFDVAVREEASISNTRFIGHTM
jgi:hypothetical protein